MKKYNKPEIVALALDNIDIIETSGARAAGSALANEIGGGATVDNINLTTVEKQLTEMSNKWSW